MRVSVTVLDRRWNSRRDVLVDAADSTPTGELVTELLGMAPARADSATVITLAGRVQGSPEDGSSRLYLHGEPLDPDTPLGESGIKEGSLLSVDEPDGSSLAEPDGTVEIRVVTGAGAGAVHRLLPGVATIGSDPSCVVVLSDNRLPPVCASLEVGVDGATTVRAAQSAVESIRAAVPESDQPLSLDRAELDTDGVPWAPGALLSVGTVGLELELTEPPDADLSDSTEAGWTDYNRPPRLLPPERRTGFKLPTHPSQMANRGLPWMIMLAPMGLAVVMALMFRQAMYLTFGLMSPMMMLGSYFQQRKQGKVTYRQQLADYREKKASIEADAEQAVVDERLARRREAPDPALALLIAIGPRVRLWERRTSDPDYLSVRLGVGDLESEVVVEDPEQLEHRRRTVRTAYDVPVAVSLAERGVVGIGASDGMRRQVGGWALAQLAVLQSPRDTWVYVLTDAAGAASWEWVRWLPHARPQQGQDTVVTLGTDTETCARRIAELSAMIASRIQVREEHKNATFPDVVVVLDGARRLRSLPGVVAILKQGPALGIYSICLDADERTLPEEATAVVLETPRGLSLRQMRVTVVDDITPDLVDDPWLQRVSRALAPIRDISGGESDSVLPTACRLTEVMELEPLGAATIKARWALSPRSTEAVVGVSLDGAFSLDMVADGPHGLVAGTTGAGKSELLQSLVAALAVANRPDGMTFVLVDYKGGAAFKDCVDLPHTVGMVTDLDTHLVERALVSLGAELTRREHLLATLSAKDIEDYVDIAAKRPGSPDMPRLLIVIDEFASLARELPDFVTGLVNVAQRGRSLGIHLILATQRPGGVVSPEIRANTNLRIALRVTDSAESQDVIDAPDSATISKGTPGRAYVRLGANSLIPFQSGRVGGRRPGAASAQPDMAPWLVEVDLPQLAKPLPGRPKAATSDDAEVTDLKVLVESIRQANDDLGLPAQHSPWLPALDTDVQLDGLLAGIEVPQAPALAPIPYGLEDLPAEQDRRAAVIDFAEFSHLTIVGGPRSGRSQALRTIAGALGRLTSPADVHLYGLDCGNGALLPLTALPHCGAVVQRTQTERALRLFSRLMAELSRRQELLAAGGFGSVDEMRVSVDEDERLPHVLLLIDRWEGFMGSLSEIDSGSPYDNVQTLLREGASVGIHLVIAGDRQAVSSRMAALVEDKIGMRMPDKQDFSMIGLRPKSLPDDIPEGRGFRSESGIELQFALLAQDVSGQAQSAALREIGATATAEYADVPAGRRPFRVDVLPSRIGFEEAWQLRDPAHGPMWAMLGVGGDELTAVGIDLARDNAAIIAGAPRSGRSTALLCVAESLLRAGTELVVAAPRPSPLRDLADRDGVRAVLTGTEIGREELEPLMDPSAGPVVFLADDGELLKNVDADDFLATVVRLGADRGQGLVLGGDSDSVGGGFTGWQVQAKGHQGLLISPQGITEGELIGVRLPRGAAGGKAAAGRAFANAGDAVLQTIQVPLHGD